MSAIDAAIITYGAAAVYQAATRHMAGQSGGLETVGIAPVTMGDVWAAQSAAYALMTDTERAIDYAQATSMLAK